MPNELLLPYLLPVQFTKLNYAEVPGYVSRFMDLHRFKDTIPNFEQHTCWTQPWMTTDTIVLPVISNYGPLSVTVYDENDEEVAVIPFTLGLQDFFRPDYYTRNALIDLSIINTTGYYYLLLNVGTSTVWVSEVLYISTDPIANTLLSQYSHYEYYGGIIFEAGIELSMRIPSVLKFKAPSSKDTLYEDQPLNIEMIKSVPYRLWDWIIGDAKGLPPWFIDKINWILGCNSLKLDGRLYAKNEGAELEQNQAELYPMAGYTIEMREKLNRDSIIYVDDTPLVTYGSMMAVADTKGFGIDGDFIPINDVQ